MSSPTYDSSDALRSPMLARTLCRHGRPADDPVFECVDCARYKRPVQFAARQYAGLGKPVPFQYPPTVDAR